MTLLQTRRLVLLLLLLVAVQVDRRQGRIVAVVVGRRASSSEQRVGYFDAHNRVAVFAVVVGAGGENLRGGEHVRENSGHALTLALLLQQTALTKEPDQRQAHRRG